MQWGKPLIIRVVQGSLYTPKINDNNLVRIFMQPREIGVESIFFSGLGLSSTVVEEDL